MFKPLLAACVVFALVLTSSCCATCCEADSSAAATGEWRAAEHEYVFVVLKTAPGGPKLEPEAMRKTMDGHMANMEKLAEAGDLLVAGPYGKGNPKPERRGIFVFDGGDVERAKGLTATDPALVAGVMVAEAHPLRSTLDFHVAQASDREFQARKDSGEVAADAPFPMHEYVLAIVGGGEAAGRALAGLHGKGVAFSGELGGEHSGSHLAVIDAQGLAAADAVLAPIRGELGEVDASPWWASASLLEVARGRDGAR